MLTVISLMVLSVFGFADNAETVVSGLLLWGIVTIGFMILMNLMQGVFRKHWDVIGWVAWMLCSEFGVAAAIACFMAPPTPAAPHALTMFGCLGIFVALSAIAIPTSEAHAKSRMSVVCVG